MCDGFRWALDSWLHDAKEAHLSDLSVLRVYAVQAG